jgi:poly(glycerol-phosphate) alpha-glucosyltransferase
MLCKTGRLRDGQEYPSTVRKVCKLLGWELPAEASAGEFPSKYLGHDLGDPEEIREKLAPFLSRKENRDLPMLYRRFRGKYETQRNFGSLSKTDLGVWFSDWLMFARRDGYSHSDYFNYEFYRKEPEERNTFLSRRYRFRVSHVCNGFGGLRLNNRKNEFNKVYGAYVNRDWLDVELCSLEEFRVFAGKHPRFFAKPARGSLGKGARVIEPGEDADLEKLLEGFREEGLIIEEIIQQHEALAEFCPDTLNTIRVTTLLDMDNVLHILQTVGKFGRMGNCVDNFHGGGMAVSIDPMTGVIVSDAVNGAHERFSRHPDTGKVFKGFQYPCWEKFRSAVKGVALCLPSLHHIGWDVAITAQGEIEVVEGNTRPDFDVTQIADQVGKLPVYDELLKKFRKADQKMVQSMGWRYRLRKAYSGFDASEEIWDKLAERTMRHVAPDSASLIDLGCGKMQYARAYCRPGMEYIPVDFKERSSDTLVCDFNKGQFPEGEADVCLLSQVLEYVKDLPDFLEKVCHAARKQVLVVCRPFELDNEVDYRREMFLSTDFSEEFLVKTMESLGFYLRFSERPSEEKPTALYDFRSTEALDEDGCIEVFQQKFFERNGRIFFLLDRIKENPPGLEIASYRRAGMFREHLGVPVYLLTHEYQRNGGKYLEAYGSLQYLRNMYDDFQEIHRQTERPCHPKFPPMEEDCSMEWLGGDFRIWKGRECVLRCVTDKEDGSVRFVNCFAHGKLVRRDIYDVLGFLSQRQEHDPVTGEIARAEFYRPNGTVALLENYEIVDGTNALRSMELVGPDGMVRESFRTRQEAVDYWVRNLIAEEKGTCFLIGDRSRRYLHLCRRLGQSGEFSHVHVLHQIHSMHLLPPYDPMSSRTEVRCRFLHDRGIKSDCVVVLTERQKEHIKKRYGSYNRMEVIPHALHGEPAPARDVDPFRIVLVGRLRGEKGHDKAFAAFRRVLQKVPQAVLHLYGTGPSEKRIRSLAAAEGVGQSVVFEGFCRNIPEVFASSALSICTSVYEGFSLVVQESLQNGCPVVSFDCNYGPADMIEDGKNGYLVGPGDVASLADRIVRILQDEALRRKMSAYARESVRKFSPSLVARQWAKIFLEIMQRDEAVS